MKKTLFIVLLFGFWSCKKEVLNYEINLSDENLFNTPLIVLMHGYGGNAYNFKKGIGENGDFDSQISIIYLEAPFKIIPLMNKKIWYDFEISNGDTISNQEQINISTDKILKTIKRIIKENDIKSKYLYLGGHSQGGIMAYKIALGNPALFEGFIASSARLPVKYSIKDELTEYQNIKALIIHGKNDNVLDVKFARAGKNLLDKLGIQTQYLVKDNGHSLVPDFAMLIQNWIEDI